MAANPFEDNQVGRTLTDDLGTTQSERLSRLLVTVDKQRSALQNTEASLITRIADVDDEQRRAVSQINKKYEAVNNSLKNTRMLAITLVLGVIAVTATVLGVFYVHTDRVHTTLLADVAELRDMANTLQRQIPENSMQNKVIQERLTQLSLRISGVTRSTEEPEAVVFPAAPVAPLARLDPAPALPEAPPAVIASPTAPVKSEPQPVPFNPALDLDPTPSVSIPTPSAATSAPSVLNRPNTETVAVTETLYSLQLIGFFSFEELIAYAQRVPLPPRVYYQTETFRGRPWFVLIHSLHTSYASAKAVIAQFPPILAELDVWIRKLPADATVTALNIQPKPAAPPP
jgi:DamX protein